ncbi:SLBB domain-containing protein [Gemmatimonadota bacterium]
MITLIQRFLPALSLLFILFQATPAPTRAQQLPPGVSMEEWNKLSAQQQAAIMQRLQQSGATAVVMQGQETVLPSILEPQYSGQDSTSPLLVPAILPFQEAPFEFGTVPQSADELEDIELFGQDIFTLEAAAWEPVLFGPVGPDYEIGPGDQLIIQMWGQVQEVYDRTVNREGYIVIPDVGQVVLTNLTVEQAKTRLLQQMTRSHQVLNYGRPGATAFLDITLGKLKVITVFVMGNAVQRGACNLSSISTAFTALYAAGGPTSTGSMRAIRVIRGDRMIKEIDLYDYLLSGDKSADIRLWDGDIVYIPDIGPRVALTGRVLRPAVYELSDSEDLLTALDMAGGLTVSASREKAQISRIVPPEYRAEYEFDQVLLDVDFSRVLSREATVALFDGDVVSFTPILTTQRNFIVVEGAVWRPGTYELTPGMTLLDAIREADDLKEEAHLGYVHIFRTNRDETTTQLSVSMLEAQNGDPANNIELFERDRIHIYSIHDIMEPKYVWIEGEIQSPGRYLLHENMTLSDLILRAGGLTRAAWTEWAEISRVSMNVDGSIADYQIIEADIDTLFDASTENSWPLQDLDHVSIRTRPQWEIDRRVMVGGEVLFPGGYTLKQDDETLVDIVERAGGLTPYAFPEGARFTRGFGDAGRLNIDLIGAMANRAGDDNLTMQPGDTLYVPPMVDFVSVRGAVGNPTSVLYVKGKRPAYYIHQAGSFSEFADRQRMQVVYPNGTAWRPNWFILRDPPLQPGSSIFVPVRTEEPGSIWQVLRDTTSILTSFTTVLILIWQINR